MKILFLSHTHTFGAFRVGSHHLSRQLARRGHTVVHYSTPLSLPHRLLHRGEIGAEGPVPHHPVVDEAGVTHLVPATVAPAGVAVPRITSHLTRYRLPTRYDALLIDQPLLWMPHLHQLADIVIFRPTDLSPTWRKVDLERRIVGQADAVLATSQTVLDALGPLRVPAFVLENGVEFDRFPQLTDAARPRAAIYIGALDERFDLVGVIAWAHAIPDCQFWIAGPGAPPTENLPTNLHFIGAVSYECVPELLYTARVGLLPLSLNPQNEGRCPMKFYEYLAAGLAVVSRATPGLREDRASGVFTYDTKTDAVSVLNKALAHPSPNHAGRDRASRQSWSSRAAILNELILALASGQTFAVERLDTR